MITDALVPFGPVQINNRMLCLHTTDNRMLCPHTTDKTARFALGTQSKCNCSFETEVLPVGLKYIVCVALGTVSEHA